MNFLLYCLILIISIKGQDIYIIPSNESHTRSLGRSLVVICLYNFTNNPSSSLAWFDNNNVPIHERTGSDLIRVFVEEDTPGQLKLYITSINKFDVGSYTCKYNDDSIALKKSIRLNIYKDITFDLYYPIQNISVNSDALIICEISGQPRPEISWRFNSQKIILGSKYMADRSGLHISNVQYADAGDYKCCAEVEIEGRYDERIIKVNVQEQPVITKSLFNLNASAFTDISLSCTASGFPAPSFKFFKNGAEVISRDQRVLVDEGLGYLYLSPVEKLDEGAYECVAFNSVGNASSKALLTVFLSPMIESFSNVTAREGELAIFKCNVVSDPKSYIDFYHNDADLSTYLSLNTHVPQQKYILEGGERKEGKLIILNVSTLDAGVVSCKAQNSIGSIEAKSYLNVQYKPVFLESTPQIAFGWSGHVTNMSCEVKSFPDSNFTWQRGKLAVENDVNFKLVDGVQTSYLMINIRDIDQGWIYTSYTCIASNLVGTNMHSIFLKRATPPDAPQEAIEVSVFPTSVILNLSPPEDDGGVPITGYRVEFEDKAQEFLRDSKVQIEDLKPSTKYLFLVRSRNEVGLGLPHQIHATTLPARIPYPVEITSNPYGNHKYSYELTWMEPAYSGLPINAYRLSYRLVKVIDGTLNISEPLETWHILIKQVEESRDLNSKTIGLTTHSLPVHHLLTNLLAASYYEVTIKSRNELGFSEPSPSFVFFTSSGIKSTSPAREQGVNDSIDWQNNTDFIYSEAESDDELDHIPSLSISSGAMIIIVLVVLLLFLIVVDLSCYVMNGCGLTMIFCSKILKKKNTTAVAGNGQGRYSQSFENERKLLAFTEEGSAQTKKKKVPTATLR